MTQHSLPSSKTGNNTALLSDITCCKLFTLLNNCVACPNVPHMKHMLLSLTLAALIAAPGMASAADCFADYKAKKDNPLRLHYGVAQVSACSAGAARSELEGRLAARGWTLLQVMSVFGPEGLDERKASAGKFYLRF